jgi:hypothetical protein
MPDAFVKRPIHRILSTGKVEAFEDEIVKEHSLPVRLDDRDFGLTVVGFVRNGKLNCHCHPERIIP